MSVNVLGSHKTYEITAAIHLPVLRAWVRSHSESGRWAYLTIGWDRTHRYHRHAWYDRRSGELRGAPSRHFPHNTSCYELFPKEMQTSAAADALAELIKALDGAW